MATSALVGWDWSKKARVSAKLPRSSQYRPFFRPVLHDFGPRLPAAVLLPHLVPALITSVPTTLLLHTDTSRTWMRDLARLRARATRLRTRGSPRNEAFFLLEQSLEVTDRLREEAAALRARCVTLERTLDQHDRELRVIFDILPVPIITTDGGGIIADANRAACVLLGRSVSALQRQWLLHFAENRAAFAVLLGEMPHATAPIRSRVRIRPQERAPFDADVTIAPGVAGDWLWFLERCPPVG